MKAENEHLIFEMGEERPWPISVTVKNSGKVWRSHLAPLTVRCWEFYLYRAVKKSLAEFEKVNLRTKVHGSVATAAFEIADWELFLNVDFHLHGDEIDVRVPVTQIHEQAPHEYRLMDLELLPGFASAPSGRGGYIVLSNLTGTLCRLERTQPAELDSPVYGTFNWNTDVPCFGMVAGDGEAVLGNILEGDCDAWVCTRFAQGPEKSNWSHARLHYRYYPNVDYDRVDRLVRYSFLSGPEADWQGMARRVNEQLLSEKDGVRSIAERIKTQPHLERNIRSLQLGTGGAGKPQIREGAPGGWVSPQCPARAKTIGGTFDGAVAALKEVRSGGSMPISVMFGGCWFDGHDGMYPTKLPMDRMLGGNRGFRRLMDYANGHGIDIMPLDNFTDLYETSDLFSPEDVVHMVDGELRRGGCWYGGHCYICCPVVAREKFMPAHFDALAALGKTEGAHYLDTYAGPWLHECYHPAHPLNRRAFSEQIGANMAYVRERLGMVECETFGIHAVAHIDCAYVGLPSHARLEGKPWYADEPVPFARMVHHGIVLCKLEGTSCSGPFTEEAVANGRRKVLRALALGGLPQFSLGGSSVGAWRPFLLETYENWLAPAARVQTVAMHRLEEVEDLVRSQYADGTVVEADLEQLTLSVRPG